MTYRNHYGTGYVGGVRTTTCLVDWQAITNDRLAFLYGPDHAETRALMTQADLASWRALGSKKP